MTIEISAASFKNLEYWFALLDELGVGYSREDYPDVVVIEATYLHSNGR